MFNISEIYEVLFEIRSY